MKTSFSVKFMQFFEGKKSFFDSQVFFLFLKGFEDISWPKAITDSPFKIIFGSFIYLYKLACYYSSFWFKYTI